MMFVSNLRRVALSLTLAVAAGAGVVPAGAATTATRPAVPTVAATPSAAATTPIEVRSVEGITEYRLTNGLQILLVPDDSKPTTTVNVTYRVGSRHESYGETGMAHLLEHLVFKGTPTTKNAMAEFARRGFRYNGTTWYDRTNYFASFTTNPDDLRWYLSWQADVMVNSFISRADLDTEMTVVRNEFESGENSPSRVLLQQTMAAMYQWHNYGKNTIGAKSDIENVDIPRLQAFYRRHYQPDNATLIVSGKFDRDRTLAWIGEFFGALPRPDRRLDATYTAEPAQDGERVVHVRRVGGTPLIYVGHHVPAAADPDFAAVEIVGQVLGDTPGGRLHRALVERELAAQTFAFTFDLAEPGVLFAGAALAPGQDADRARAALTATIDALKAEPITAVEFERARAQWLNAWDRAYTDPERIGVALSEAIAQGDWRLYFLQRDRVRRLALADVNRVARTWLVRDNRTVGVYLPTTQPERAPTPRRVDVAALVADYRGDASAAQAEAFDPTPARLDERTQNAQVGGLEVALLPKGTRGNVVHARLRLRFGDEKSLFGLETVSAFTASLIDKGGAGLTRQQIDDRFEALQAQVSFGGVEQTLTVSITTKRDRLPDVVALVGRLLREPAFPAEPLEEVRRQAQAAIERQRKEPDAVIANLVARHGNPYPPGDLRYAPSFDEMQRNAAAVTREQVRDFHRRFYSAARGEFVAVGDLDAAATLRALQTSFGDWQASAAGGPAYVRVARPLVAVAPERIVAVTPDKANAHLHGRLALPVSDRHPDYAALMTANFIFGQSGNSRLWQRIRESEGLSYDVRAMMAWSSLDANTGWHLSAIFAPQSQPKVEAALKDELAKSVRDGFTQRELDEGRQSLLGYRRLSRAQDPAVAGLLLDNLYLDRTFAYSQQVDDAIAALTLERLNAVWRQYIDPERLVLAWGGDFKAAAAQ